MKMPHSVDAKISEEVPHVNLFPPKVDCFSNMIMIDSISRILALLRRNKNWKNAKTGHLFPTKEGQVFCDLYLEICVEFGGKGFRGEMSRSKCRGWGKLNLLFSCWSKQAELEEIRVAVGGRVAYVSLWDTDWPKQTVYQLNHINQTKNQQGS